MWQPYYTPELKSLIQDVINREGWNPGNALTLFLRGEDQGASLLDNARDFESFENIEDPEDGGDGLHHPERIPMLVINYTTNSSGFGSFTAPLNTLRVYPSVSADGMFKIVPEQTTSTQIDVYNTTGNLVKSLSSSGSEILLDLSKFSKGVYIITALQNNSVYTRKVVVE